MPSLCRGAFLVLLTASTALGQEGGDDAIALLRAADDAFEGVRTLTCEVSVEGVGAMVSEVPAGTYRLTLARSESPDALGWKFMVDGVDARGADPVPVRGAYDGVVFRSLRPAERLVLQAKAPDAPGLLASDPLFHVLGWAVRWSELITDPFLAPGASAEARAEGLRRVEGVPCRVVRTDYSEIEDPRLFAGWWYLGHDDALPRRVELFYYDEQRGEGFVRVTIRQVGAGAAVPQGAFALAVPEGYQAVAFEPPPHGDAVHPEPEPQAIVVGSPAPDWTLKDPQGREHRLADYRGKVVLLDFWATWCPPCRAAMPGIQRLHEELGPRGLVVLGVNAWESGDPVAYMRQQKFTYGLLLRGDEVASAYGVSGIPTFYVIDPEGKVAYSGVGYSPDGEKKLEEAIRRLLKGEK